MVLPVGWESTPRVPESGVLKLAPHVGPAGGQRHAVIALIGAGQPPISGISIDLQDIAIAVQMTGNACTGAAILEAIRHHGRIAAAEGAIVTAAVL